MEPNTSLRCVGCAEELLRCNLSACLAGYATGCHHLEYLRHGRQRTASAISLRSSEVTIPVIEKWCKEINMPPRLFLMPMSYFMSLG